MSEPRWRTRKFTAASSEKANSQKQPTCPCMEDWLNEFMVQPKAGCMLLLKNGAKFYALTWKDLQDILFMKKKSCRMLERGRLHLCLQVHTHTQTHRQVHKQMCVHTHTHPNHYAHFKDEETEGLPWWFRGKDSSLPMQGAQVQSLVRELDPIW